MLKGIAGVIAGYVVIFAVVVISFTLAYRLMGADGAFKEGSWDVSLAWSVLSVAIGLIAAMAAGFVCKWISGGPTAPFVLAGLVLVLGIAEGVYVMSVKEEAPPAPRTSQVGGREAMLNASQPTWMLVTNPLIGAVGVIIGAGLKRTRRTGVSSP